MKRFYLFLSVTGLFIFFTSSVLSPAKLTDIRSATLVAAAPIPDDLQVIFKNSCMGCHATGGKGMAMSKVNFSEWENYDAGKQAKKAAAICNVLTKGSMPPKSFRESHPEAVPTAAQKDMICKWSETLAPKK